MSLDIYLYSKAGQACKHCNGTGISQEKEELFTANLTHNLAEMADQAGIYDALWSPEEKGYKRAAQLVHVLENGLKKLKKDPEKYKKLDTAYRAYVTYENFIPCLEEYLLACKENPDALIEVSR